MCRPASVYGLPRVPRDREGLPIVPSDGRPSDGDDGTGAGSADGDGRGIRYWAFLYSESTLCCSTGSLVLSPSTGVSPLLSLSPCSVLVRNPDDGSGCSSSTTAGQSSLIHQGHVRSRSRRPLAVVRCTEGRASCALADTKHACSGEPDIPLGFGFPP